MKYLYLSIILLSLQLKAQNLFSSDTVLQHIYTAQYDRQPEKLRFYSTYKSDLHRYYAIIGFASVQDKNYYGLLLGVLQNDKNADIRKAAALSIGQLYDSTVCGELMTQYKVEQDRQVKYSILEAIGRSSCVHTYSFYEQFEIELRDTTAIQAYMRSAYLAYRRKRLNDATVKNIKKVFAKYNDPYVMAIYKRMTTVMKPADEPKKTERTLKAVMDSLANKSNANPYAKLAFLKRTKFKNLADWKTLAASLTEHPAKTYCVEQYLTLSKTVSDDDLIAYLNSGDVASVSLACERIRKDSLWDKNPEKYLPVIVSAIEKVVTPRDYETYLDLYKTKYQIMKEALPGFNFFASGYQNPIDWNYVAGIQQDKLVKITTGKGDVVIKLKVNESPGSVANFMKLVDSGYYNGKYFHRMVSDFVVQGGCPRGDGWGSLNWMQRSEFSNELKYQPGSVGLASSGKDSEGVQFFITHTFTTHLDGRYTIFAEVVEGMEVVNQLKEGDQIISIAVVEY